MHTYFEKWYYVHYPDVHGPEDIGQAILLDNLLGELWGGHRNYVKILGTRDIEEKIDRGLGLITKTLSTLRHKYPTD